MRLLAGFIASMIWLGSNGLAVAQADEATSTVENPPASETAVSEPAPAAEPAIVEEKKPIGKKKTSTAKKKRSWLKTKKSNNN